jgi:hypothetical protein
VGVRNAKLPSAIRRALADRKLIQTGKIKCATNPPNREILCRKVFQKRRDGIIISNVMEPEALHSGAGAGTETRITKTPTIYQIPQLRLRVIMCIWK